MPDNHVEYFEVFPWNSNFETGIAIVDEQHKQLVHLLNQLAAHLAHQSDPVALNKVFAELADYADHHFKTEEGIWHPYFSEDPWYISHQHTHQSFLENVVRLKEEEGTKSLDEVIEDILKFLTHWLAYHILDSDKRMAKTIQAIDSGLSLEQAKEQANQEMSGSMKLLIDTVLAMYDSLSSRTLDLMKEKAERTRIEKALKESEKQEKGFSDAVMNIVPGLLYLYDDQLRLVRWNRKVSELTGYSDEKLANKYMLDFFDEEHHQAILDRVKCVHNGEHVEVEQNLLRQDGTLIPCLFTAVPLQVNGLNYIAGIAIDISDRKQAEKALLKSQQQFYQAQKMEAVGTLVGGIAHDFNNMLAGITGNLYLAKRRSHEMPDVVQRLTDVEELSFRASDMIQQLLTFARKGEVSMKPISFVSFIKETLKLLRASTPENIELNQYISNDLIQVNGNVTQLHQVLMNLVNNARDAVENIQNPAIHIKLESFSPDEEFLASHSYFMAGKYAHLSVQDNGCGIPQDQMDHLFEPFFTTKDEGKGTGLGLAMVFGAIKTHEGFVEVVSDPAAGSTFHIYLPLYEKKKVKTKKLSETIMEGYGETILIVDDNDEVRRSSRDILESLNYQVCEASDGLEAIQVFSANQHDIALIIIDLVMPKLGGVEAINQIRAIRSDIKVIYSTGYDKNEVLKDSISENENVILSKPLQVEDFSTIIWDQLNG